MSKKFISFAIILVLLLGLFPCYAFAVDIAEDTDIILLDDGSYIEVMVETSPARAANTVSGSKKYVCRDSDGDVMWEAKLSATFAYSGAWYTCATADCDVTIYESNWYVISNSTTRSSNNAYAYLTMGRRVLGVTVERPEYTIKLTCDINGNLS